MACFLVALIVFSAAGQTEIGFRGYRSSADEQSPNLQHAATNPFAPWPFLYAQGQQLMLQGRQFTMKGFHYFPKDYAWTSVQAWNWTAVDQDLALGAGLGSNTVAVELDYQFSTGNFNYPNPWWTTYHVQKSYVDAFKQFLSLADKHGLKVLVELARPNIALILPTNFGTYNSYLTELVPHFANDSRIAAWDLLPEADVSWNLWNYSTAPTKSQYLWFVGNVSQTLRLLDPYHLQTTGWAYAADAGLLSNDVDFISFHYYGTTSDAELLPCCGVTVRLGGDVHNIGDALASLPATSKPVVLEEFGWPTINDSGYGGTPDTPSGLDFQAMVYDMDLHDFLQYRPLAGAVFWTLLDFNAPKVSQSEFPSYDSRESHFGVYDVHYKPKPGANVVKQYFSALTNTVSYNEITFTYNKVVSTSSDVRQLAAYFERLDFLASNRTVLAHLDFGTRDARKYLGTGWYHNENGTGYSYVWSGGASKMAQLHYRIPNGTAYMRTTAFPSASDVTSSVSIDGQKTSSLTFANNFTFSFSFIKRNFAVGRLIPVMTVESNSTSNFLAFNQAGRTVTSGFVSTSAHIFVRLQIPKLLLGGRLTASADAYSTPFSLLSNSTYSTLTLNLGAGSHSLLIQGSVSTPSTLLADSSFGGGARVSVGQGTQVGYHLSKIDGSSAVGVSVVVNGTSATTNSTGWANLNVISQAVGQGRWLLTNVNGTNYFANGASNLSLTFDRVRVQVWAVANWVEAGSDSGLSYLAAYAYDSHPFVGSVTLNSTLAGKGPGTYFVSAQSISDYRYGLAAFSSNSLKVTVFSPPPCSFPSSQIGSSFLSRSGSRLFLDGKPFLAVGVNSAELLAQFLGATFHYYSDPSVPLEQGKKAIDDASKCGFKFIRTSANLFWPNSYPYGMKLWQSDPAKYWAGFDTMVNYSNSRGVRLVLTVLWNNFVFSDMAGEPHSQLFNSSSRTWNLFSSYVQQLVSRYKNNPTILSWEIANEMDIYADSKIASDLYISPTQGTPNQRTSADDYTTAQMSSFLARTASLIKSSDPNHLVSSGLSEPLINAYWRQSAPDWNQNTASFNEDSYSQFALYLRESTPDPVDLVSVHFYDNSQSTQRFGIVGAYNTTMLAFIKKAADSMNKPLFVGEFGQEDVPITADPSAKFTRAVLGEVVALKIPISSYWAWEFWDNATSLSNDSLMPGKTDALISWMIEANLVLNNQTAMVTTTTSTTSSTSSTPVTSTSTTSTTTSSSTTPTISTTQATTTTVSSTSTTSSRTSTSSASGGAGIPEFSLQPLLSAVLVVLVVASYLAARSRVGSMSRWRKN